MNKIFFSVKSFKNTNNIPVLTHYHDSIELIHILEGSLKCLIQDKEYTLEKGSLCIINQKQSHRIYSNEENNCVFQSLVIEPTIFTSDKDIYNKYIETILLDENFSHIVFSPNNRSIKDIVNFMNAIEELENSKLDAYELSVIAYIHMIFQNLYVIHERIKNKISEPINTDALIYRKMSDFVYKNYFQKLSLDDIAISGNISRSKCCLIFKKYAQNSPIDFLNLYRLEVSTSLLENTNDSVSSIAIDCGFGQQSYYNRLFLREYNMTPKEYRNNGYKSA